MVCGGHECATLKPVLGQQIPGIACVFEGRPRFSLADQPVGSDAEGPEEIFRSMRVALVDAAERPVSARDKDACLRIGLREPQGLDEPLGRLVQLHAAAAGHHHILEGAAEHDDAGKLRGLRRGAGKPILEDLQEIGAGGGEECDEEDGEPEGAQSTAAAAETAEHKQHPDDRSCTST